MNCLRVIIAALLLFPCVQAQDSRVIPTEDIFPLGAPKPEYVVILRGLVSNQDLVRRQAYENTARYAKHALTQSGIPSNRVIIPRAGSYEDFEHQIEKIASQHHGTSPRVKIYYLGDATLKIPSEFGRIKTEQADMGAGKKRPANSRIEKVHLSFNRRSDVTLESLDGYIRRQFAVKNPISGQMVPDSTAAITIAGSFGEHWISSTEKGEIPRDPYFKTASKYSKFLPVNGRFESQISGQSNVYEDGVSPLSAPMDPDARMFIALQSGDLNYLKELQPGELDGNAKFFGYSKGMRSGNGELLECPTGIAQQYTLPLCDPNQVGCILNQADAAAKRIHSIREEIQFGDVDGNGKIEEADYTKLFLMLGFFEDFSGKSEKERTRQAFRSDANADGKIDVEDLALIKGILEKKENALEAKFVGNLPIPALTQMDRDQGTPRERINHSIRDMITLVQKTSFLLGSNQPENVDIARKSLIPKIEENYPLIQIMVRNAIRTRAISGEDLNYLQRGITELENAYAAFLENEENKNLPEEQRAWSTRYQNITMGDLDGDGKISHSDLKEFHDYFFSFRRDPMDSSVLFRMDLNRDGVINELDERILRWTVLYDQDGDGKVIISDIEALVPKNVAVIDLTDGENPNSPGQPNGTKYDRKFEDFDFNYFNSLEIRKPRTFTTANPVPLLGRYTFVQEGREIQQPIRVLDFYLYNAKKSLQRLGDQGISGLTGVVNEKTSKAKLARERSLEFAIRFMRYYRNAIENFRENKKVYEMFKKEFEVLEDKYQKLARIFPNLDSLVQDK